MDKLGSLVHWHMIWLMCVVRHTPFLMYTGMHDHIHISVYTLTVWLWNLHESDFKQGQLKCWRALKNSLTHPSSERLGCSMQNLQQNGNVAYLFNYYIYIQHFIQAQDGIHGSRSHILIHITSLCDSLHRVTVTGPRPSSELRWGAHCCSPRMLYMQMVPGSISCKES